MSPPFLTYPAYGLSGFTQRSCVVHIGPIYSDSRLTDSVCKRQELSLEFNVSIDRMKLTGTVSVQNSKRKKNRDYAVFFCSLHYKPTAGKSTFTASICSVASAAVLANRRIQQGPNRPLS